MPSKDTSDPVLLIHAWLAKWMLLALTGVGIGIAIEMVIG